MHHIVSFDLVSMTETKDSTGQVQKTPSNKSVIGKLYSVYQNEFYKAEQAGLRPQGVIEMSSFDYEGEKYLILDEKTYSIYRTFEKGTDKIELYYGERVGNGQSTKTS